MKLQDTENIVLFLRALLLRTIQARRNNTLKLDFFFSSIDYSSFNLYIIKG